MKVGIILVNYKDYAQRFLTPCLASIRALDASCRPDIFIVDNASTAESAAYLRDQAPAARFIFNKNNDGFAKGNNDALRLMMAENYDYALLLNMDASLAPRALTELVRIVEANPDAAAVQARLMFNSDREMINSLGNVTHFLGFGYCDAYRQTFLDRGEEIKKIAYPSGAAVLLRMEALRAVGLLDEEFWMYNEDQDLGWRFWLSGWQCLLAFKAVAYHQYEFSRSISKYYWMERNRLIAAWKNYSILSLILFLPPLLAMELGMSFFALRSGWLKEKKRAWAYFFNLKNWSYLLQARKQAQTLRCVPDYKILPLFSGHIWYQEIDNPVLKYLVNPLFSFYFFIARRIIRICRQ
ncbi:MAG TPA: glycosyltransferase family 2 protein [bacterium]|nr:glycosyltransferase family 2 protein [bacterium]HQQ38213.1 glycosyltransferase family 2 protein [bacterium]